MAVVRRALDRHFPAIEPGDAAWQGHIGLSEVLYEPTWSGLDGTPHALVRLQARVVDLPLDGALAQALAVEQAWLPIGRLEHDGRGRRRHGIPARRRDAGRRGGDHRARTRSRRWPRRQWPSDREGGGQGSGRARHRARERPSAARCGRADHPRGGPGRASCCRPTAASTAIPPGGTTGPFGSARVFVDVRPFLGESTSCGSPRPCSSRIELGDELALRALEIADGRSSGTSRTSRSAGAVVRAHAARRRARPGGVPARRRTPSPASRTARTTPGRAFGGLRYADLAAGARDSGYRSRLQLVGRGQHRAHDLLVARAAAEVARQRQAHLVLAGTRVLAQQRRCADQHARACRTRTARRRRSGRRAAADAARLHRRAPRPS